MPSSASAPIEAAGRAPSASLERLTARNYRNFGELRLELPEAGAMIIGPNGSGKTNLLEAIYYLEIFRSFRGARDSELVRFGEDVFRIEGAVREGEATEELAAAYQKTGRRKKVEVDGGEADRIADALGALGAVVLSLEDADLVCGSPGRRRRFLDILLSLVAPGYLASLQRYRAVLAQRNEALRQGTRDLVDVWTEGLIEPGARVMTEREAWIASVASAFETYHRDIAGGWSGTLSYEAALGGRQDPVAADRGESVAESAVSYGLDRTEHWGERLREAMAENADRDARRGSTQAGPQRDDLVIRAVVEESGEERDLRTYGSGGQQRSAAIALRLVEADTLREKLGRDPIYLLDDVFAELDRDRAERVVRLLDEGRSGQVLMTAPKPADIELRGGGLARWRIREGVVFTDG
ncbi:MAG: DNA replication and repair protein RecF [marine benthic group bacterium]|nr:DNA replication and repair protein RecF [Candidatus Benthicola marisminoris]